MLQLLADLPFSEARPPAAAGFPQGFIGCHRLDELQSKLNFTVLFDAFASGGRIGQLCPPIWIQ
jgi:hypothetical protein